MTPRNQNDSTDEYWYCIQDKIFPISLSLLSFPSPVGKFYKTGWIFLYLMGFFKCNVHNHFRRSTIFWRCKRAKIPCTQYFIWILHTFHCGDRLYRKQIWHFHYLAGDAVTLLIIREDDSLFTYMGYIWVVSATGLNLGKETSLWLQFAKCVLILCTVHWKSKQRL